MLAIFEYEIALVTCTMPNCLFGGIYSMILDLYAKILLKLSLFTKNPRKVGRSYWLQKLHHIHSSLYLHIFRLNQQLFLCFWPQHPEKDY